MWLGAFNDYPRQMGYPSRNGCVYNLHEFLEKVNRVNGKLTCFTSLYGFDRVIDNKPDYESARIKHIYFDLDHNDCLANTCKLHEYLLNENLLHNMLFSGRGFHIYIGVEYPNYLKSKKDSIFNAVTSIAEKLKLSVGINESDDVDAHTIGNIAQLVRVPNTFNMKRKRFCIPLYHEDLSKSYDEICQEALHQRVLFPVYGEKFLDLTPFDREPIAKYRLASLETGESIGIDYIDINKFPPCIRELCTKRLKSHRERYYIILYLKHIGLPFTDVFLFLKKFLDTKTYSHCCYEERQPHYIYSRGDLDFPKCDTLEKNGICTQIEKCIKNGL